MRNFSFFKHKDSGQRKKCNQVVDSVQVWLKWSGRGGEGTDAIVYVRIGSGNVVYIHYCLLFFYDSNPIGLSVAHSMEIITWVLKNLF